MKKPTLWTKNYCLLIFATVLGCVGGIAGGYAMSFLVYEETGSTLAAGLLAAIRIIPQFLLPILIAPLMDRLPRKPFLVLGDLIGGILYILAGLYLRLNAFSYTGYLVFTLVLASIGAMDSLAFNSIFPKIIPSGFEEKGYTVSGMVYPVLNILVMPLAAVLMRTIGVSNILLTQGILCIVASITESRIDIRESSRSDEEKVGLSLWWKDFKDGFRYLKGEPGLLSIYSYMAVTNGAATGYSPILVAFFGSAPGFTAVMYSFFSAAEFIGRSLGGLFQYHVKIPKEKRFGFAFFVYQVYETMDMILLWLPYPLMLINRAICGFLGINSATMRAASVQRYLPDAYRARVNAFEEAAISAAGSILSLAVGALGEVLDYKLTLTITAGVTMAVCWLTIWKNRTAVKGVYEKETGEN